jgi:hypothetical protein
MPGFEQRLLLHRYCYNCNRPKFASVENSLGKVQDRLGQEMAGSARLRAEIAAAHCRGSRFWNLNMLHKNLNCNENSKIKL